MASLTIRIGQDLLDHLDEMATTRGLKDRSQAARVAIQEASMDPEDRKTVPERDELLRLLGDSARGGSVTAMKALLEEHRRDGNEDTPEAQSVVDQLAAKRASRTG